MRTTNTDDAIVGELRESGLAQRMKSLELCKFLVVEEDGGRIVGACGVGGLFNVPSLQIADEYQGRGIGKKLLQETLKEARQRGYSFIAGSRNPKNARAIKLHDFFGFYPVFRVHYTDDITRDVIILIMRPRGRLVSAFFGIFNNLAGMIVLSLALKAAKPLFGRVLTYSPGEFPAPSITCMIRNFRKLSRPAAGDAA